MKKIKRADIEKQVKEEFKAARQWCDQDWRRYYKMMIDTEDGNIWSDVFLSENEWKEYHKESVIKLDAFSGYVHEMESEYIEDAEQKLRAAGWEVIV